MSAKRIIAGITALVLCASICGNIYQYYSNKQRLNESRELADKYRSELSIAVDSNKQLKTELDNSQQQLSSVAGKVDDLEQSTRANVSTIGKAIDLCKKLRKEIEDLQIYIDKRSLNSNSLDNNIAD